MTENIVRLHEHAVEISNTHRKSEAELISVLQEIDFTRAFLHFGARSLSDYCERILKLSEGTSYNLITVARRARSVPALKDAVESGAISISKARKIAPILTNENKDTWLTLAATKSSREIERAVAKENPQVTRLERFNFISEDFVRASLDVPESLMKTLRRIQDLESQRTSKPVTLIESIAAMAGVYLEYRDPVIKAERVTKRKENSAKRSGPTPKSVDPDTSNHVIEMTAHSNSELVPGRVRLTNHERKSIRAELRHALNLRDGCQCTHVDRKRRCPNTRWLEFHHIIPVSDGGLDTLENLTTLCSIHHRHTNDKGPTRVNAPTQPYSTSISVRKMKFALVPSSIRRDGEWKSLSWTEEPHIAKICRLKTRPPRMTERADVEFSAKGTVALRSSRF